MVAISLCFGYIQLTFSFKNASASCVLIALYWDALYTMYSVGYPNSSRILFLQVHSLCIAIMFFVSRSMYMFDCSKICMQGGGANSKRTKGTVPAARLISSSDLE